MARASFFLLFLGLLVSGCDSCSCEETEVLPSAATSAEAPIKTKTSYFAPNQPAQVAEYVYDGSGKLTEVEEYLYSPDKTLFGYQRLTYDSESRLAKREHFYKPAGNLAPEAWPRAQQTTYSYQGNLLHRQETTYPQNGNGEILTYAYEGSTLVKVTRTSSQGEAQGYTAYAYDGHGNQIRESLHMASGERYRYHEFAYRNGRRVRAEEFASQSDSPLSRSEYRYDRHGNLVEENATVLNPLLCVMPTPLVRYEY